MKKDELYNQLLDKVGQAGGYVRFGFPPILGKGIYIAAIFEGRDDISPLKVIDQDFNVFDLYDYFGENDISWLISFVEINKKGE